MLWIISYLMPITTLRLLLILQSLFYMWENWSSERKICLTKVTQLVSEVAGVWTLAVHEACSFNYSLLRNDSNFNSQQIINFLNAKLWIICLFFLWFVLIPSPYMILLFIVSSISQLAILRNWSTASSYVSTAPFLIVAAL